MSQAYSKFSRFTALASASQSMAREFASDPASVLASLGLNEDVLRKSSPELDAARSRGALLLAGARASSASAAENPAAVIAEVSRSAAQFLGPEYEVQVEP